MLFAALALSWVPQAPPATAPAPRDVGALLAGDARFSKVLASAKEYRLQVLLAEPVPRPDGSIGLQRSQIGDPGQYFYPASAIKLCGGIAALLSLNAANRGNGTPHGLSTALQVEPLFAGDALLGGDRDHPLTIARLLREMLLVSDNGAYNHCYELAGQDGLNRTMWDAGFRSVRLWHRLSEARTPAENQRTRSLVLRTDGVETKRPARDCGLPLQNDLWHDLDVGTGYLQGGKRIDGPMSFAQKNAILLQDLQDVLVETVRPEIDTGKRGFPELTVAQRAFVVQALGELPRESQDPRYDPAKVPDHACKFVLRGVRRVVPAEHVRVYDKIGRAYGFSDENAYIEDLRTGRGCFLAIVLYTNPDGVLNDDRYGYEELADPFLDDVGEVVARAVFGR
jgi:hypothetical protein